MELCFINNKVCIYCQKDWENLRRNHRIIGEHLGASQTILTLPIALLPEEALLLVKKNIIKILSYPDLRKPPTQADYDDYKHKQAQLLEAERAIYKEQRKEDLKQIIDKIVEGKRKKGVIISREAVLEEELGKQSVTEDTMIWPILTESSKKFGVASPSSLLLSQTTPTKVAVFEDLWTKGYYITCGKKFGGDFLVYTGDPIAFHAVYIVRCVEDVTREMHLSEVVAFGRLGTSVKKKSVLASFTNGNVDYMTINWLDLVN